MPSSDDDSEDGNAITNPSEALKIKYLITLLEDRDFDSAWLDFQEKFPTPNYRFADQSLLHKILDVVEKLRDQEELDLDLFVRLTMAIVEMDPRLVKTPSKPQKSNEEELPLLVLHRVIGLQFHDADHLFEYLIQCILEAYPQAMFMPGGANEDYPLHIAARDALDEKTILQVLEQNPNAASCRNKRGELPLELILQRQSDQCFPIDFLDRFYEATPRALELVGERCLRPITRTEEHDTTQDPSVNWVLSKWPHVCRVPDEAGNLPLHRLPLNRYISLATLRRLINLYPAGLVHRNDDGDTPLHTLIMHGSFRSRDDGPEFIQMFLRQGESMPCGRRGRLPLHFLMDLSPTECRHEKIWNVLYRAYPGALMAQDFQGNTPLHLAKSVVDAEKCIDANPNICKVANHKGDLPLHVLVRMQGKNSKLIRAALEAFPEAARHQNKQGELPLHTFLQEMFSFPKRVSKGKMLVFDLLARAFPAGFSHADQNGYFSIHHCMETFWPWPGGGYAAALEELLEKTIAAAPNCATAITKGGNTILHLAREPTILEWMIQRYPQLCRVRNKDGNLPLHVALENPRICVESIRKLVDSFPGSVMTANLKKQLPIHKAARYPYLENIQLLIDRYPGGVSVQDDDGRLPIHHFLSNEYIPMAVLELLDELYPSGKTELDKFGNSSLHLVNVYSMNWMKANTSDWDKLCQAQNHSGEYPIHVVDLYTFSVPALQTLTKAVPDCFIHPDAVKANTPLHNAALSGASTAIIHWLLGQAPMAASHANKDGRLPLHLLAQSNSHFKEQTLKALRACNPAALKVFDNDGYLPVHYACLRKAGLRSCESVDAWLAEEHKSALPSTQGGTPLVFLTCQTEETENPLDILTRIYSLLHRSLDLFGNGKQCAQKRKRIQHAWHE